MNSSHRGAVITTAILAGTLSSLLVVIGYLAATGRHDRPAVVASTQTMGSLPRPSQVRPADVAVASTPALSPSAIPAAQPSTAATPRPTTVAAEPPSRPAPAPTPWPTPRPVATPRLTPAPTTAVPAVESTQFQATVSAGGTVLGQSGPIAGTTATTTTWQLHFTIDVPPQGIDFAVDALATWQFDGFDPHTMVEQSNAVGTVGCDGNFRPIVDENSGPVTTDSGYLDSHWSNNPAFYDSNVGCPVVASGVLTATLSPAS